MEFHPFADAFTLLQGKELAAFVADVRSNGLRQDIVTYQGKILDGRNRYLACQRAGVEPRFVTAAIATDDEARAYVESVNDRRRHQDPEARKSAVLRLRALGKSTTQIAEEVGMSPKGVHKALEQAERSTSNQCQVEQPPAPKAITGKDGKKRPPKKAKPAEQKERKDRAKKKKADGKSVRQIAKEEGVSVGTVARDLGPEPDPPPVDYAHLKAVAGRVDRAIKSLQKVVTSVGDDEWECPHTRAYLLSMRDSISKIQLETQIARGK